MEIYQTVELDTDPQSALKEPLRCQCFNLPYRPQLEISDPIILVGITENLLPPDCQIPGVAYLLKCIILKKQHEGNLKRLCLLFR